MFWLDPEAFELFVAASFDHTVDEGAASFDEISPEVEPKHLFDESVLGAGRHPAATHGLGDMAVATDQGSPDGIEVMVDPTNNDGEECFKLGDEGVLGRCSHGTEEHFGISEELLHLGLH